MKRGAAVAIVAAALLLVGCSSIDRGTITEKVHEPQRTYLCSAKPIIFCNDDEDWRFDIRNEDETGWVYVTEETFNEYDEGDFYG